MRKPLLDADGVVVNVAAYDEPLAWRATARHVTGTVTRPRNPKDPQSPLVRTTAVVATEFDIPGHGMRRGHGPLRARARADTLPAGMDEATRYFAVVVDADTIRLSETYRGAPIVTQDLGGDSLSLEEEEPALPPGIAAAVEDADPDNPARIGGRWDAATESFLPPPAADEAGAATGGAES